MPVFDFSDTPNKKEATVCTYTTFVSNEKIKTPQEPILVQDKEERACENHSTG